MRKLSTTVILLITCTLPGWSEPLPGTSIEFPFPGVPSSDTTTAIHKDSPLFTGWADGYTQISYGTEADALWKTPQKALGPATSGIYDIVCLGNGGQITMTFSRAITDGDGFDFAVFENGVSDTALELAWVEVSSDGTHFTRFPNFYAGTNSVGGYSGHNTISIYGLASKYQLAYGTPFDLDELTETYLLAISGSNSVYSAEYKTALTHNYPFLNLNNIQYIRIVDIIGDGSSKEASGRAIYDPTPTFGSGGFDLEAIGAIHQITITGTPQTITFPSIPNQRIDTGLVTLDASSDSELPVTLTLIDGLAQLTGNQLTFTNSGIIQIQATQPGDSVFTPAVPVIRIFTVAEKLQHIYLDHIPNQIADSSAWNLTATTDSGLPVAFEVTEGPASAYVIYNTTQLNIGNTPGTATLRAYQPGNETYAAATDVYQQYEIVTAGNTNAPLTFSLWCASKSIPNDTTLDSDHDGASNLYEYGMGTDPTDPSDKPHIELTSAINSYSEAVMQLEVNLSKTAYVRAQFQKTPDLNGIWSNAIPELITSSTNGNINRQTLQLPMTNSTEFVKISLGEIE